MTIRNPLLRQIYSSFRKNTMGAMPIYEHFWWHKDVFALSIFIILKKISDSDHGNVPN